ncbi:MAG TPA: S8 family peptidase [Rhizobiaceae bacterium]|nr:S8 family peptidase [Rhizobiaceae bacterium]
MALRDDPASLAPDRVIVFEVAGDLGDFRRAVERVPGLEFLGESDIDFAADADFAVIDTRKGREGQDRPDKRVPGRFYLTMPDTAAFEQLLSLWEQWERTGRVSHGLSAFANLFQQLHAVRPWGPLDRVDDDTIAFWREETQRHPQRAVRIEVELWFRLASEQRESVSSHFRRLVAELRGTVVHEAQISEIAYHGFLVDVPAIEIESLIRREAVALAIADDVMFLRPQSVFISPADIEPFEDASPRDPGTPADGATPIAALLDGVPLVLHDLLRDRLMLDDPDDLAGRTVVQRRVHGTAMASLVVHGDLNAGGPALLRPVYVRPILAASPGGDEQSDSNRLLVDTLYRAILRMRGSAGEDPVAPSVFIVNLSVGDPRRPFTLLVSPLARVLDYLAARFGLLFLVSAGNSTAPLSISGFASWSDFAAAPAQEREKAVLASLNAAKHERSILSPAESINALTIGAHHDDKVTIRPATANAVDPFDDSTLPNASSSLGLGYRRAIKPELFLPGGREYLRMRASGGSVEVGFGAPQRLFGLSAASPDPSGQARTNQLALSDGTSSATALGTRAAHRIFDALMDPDVPSQLRQMDPGFYAVVVKALLVHRARWNGKAELLREICGPHGPNRNAERSENVCRFIGFGVPNIEETLEFAAHRATLVGYGTLGADKAVAYRVPLPPSLERVREPRSLTITVAWLSPVKSGHRSYRCVRIEAAPHDPAGTFGVDRLSDQPMDHPVKRGTVFHEHFHGQKAVPFVDDGHLNLLLWRKEDAGGVDNEVRFGIAVTIEAGEAIPVYEEIQQRLRVRPRP